MKKLIKEVEGEGMETFLGERVFLMCANYFYTGKLIGVNKEVMQLENPAIVYETGEWNCKTFDEQQLHVDTFYVRMAAIEAFGLSKLKSKTLEAL